MGVRQAVKAGGPDKPKKGLSSRERREIEKLEKSIESLEKKRRELEDKLESGHKVGAGYTELAQWAKRVEEITGEIEQAEERWMELSELA
jgi:chromosome segregation ATPase